MRTSAGASRGAWGLVGCRRARCAGVKALAISLRLGVPSAINNLRGLAAYLNDLGPKRFADLLSQSTSDAKLIEVITSLLGESGKPDGNTG
jgi:hypothetical protein